MTGPEGIANRGGGEEIRNAHKSLVGKTQNKKTNWRADVDGTMILN
jgi:hypothetical protein